MTYRILGTPFEGEVNYFRSGPLRHLSPQEKLTLTTLALYQWHGPAEVADAKLERELGPQFRRSLVRLERKGLIRRQVSDISITV